MVEKLILEEHGLSIRAPVGLNKRLISLIKTELLLWPSAEPFQESDRKCFR